MSVSECLEARLSSQHLIRLRGEHVKCQKKYESYPEFTFFSEEEKLQYGC